MRKSDSGRVPAGVGQAGKRSTLSRSERLLYLPLRFILNFPEQDFHGDGPEAA